MTSLVHIAVDCMSGDLGPHNNLDGINVFLRDNLNTHLHLCGDASIISQFSTKFPKNSFTIHDVKGTISPTLKPSAAIRLKEKTSLHVAVELVKNQQADIVVSSANTGAYMALCLKIIGLSSVKRPAIGKVLPSLKPNSLCKQTLLLDLGANINCTPEMLADFAKIGALYLGSTYSIAKPKTAILNIGSEAGKGTEELQAAAELLAHNENINFIGFIESDSLLSGDVDLIVCDGFHGNIALKAMEGTIQSFYFLLKKTLSTPNLFATIGKFFVGKTIKQTFGKTYNPKRYNGALLMGLNGNALKSHGGADEEAFYYALRAAYDIMQPQKASF